MQKKQTKIIPFTLFQQFSFVFCIVCILVLFYLISIANKIQCKFVQNEYDSFREGVSFNKFNIK